MRFNTFSIGFVILVTFTFSCDQDPYSKEYADEWLKSVQLDSNFSLDIIAHEPLLEAPVALDFDLEGRMWVVEMIGYMQNMEGSGEEKPSGSIVILEDKNGDGGVDSRTVFLDQLVLPRALLHCYGGLLYSEPPNLWFVEIKNDRPGKRTLVDSTYADGGNVEHQANGLLLNLDNWIYSAKSNLRYRLVDGIWKKEFTAYRGQWGITNDNEGRLYYNDNSNQFKGDHFLPQVAVQNVFQKPRNSINVQIIKNQNVYPIQATAVNRGYQDGTLHPNGKLTRFTSSCGPVVYRGGMWGTEFDQNSFVCGPEVNLIKWNKLNFKKTTTSGKQVLDSSECIVSSDEGFRPVNIYNGPSGDLYITDMHRGIIQHKSYMTEYLRKKMLERSLDTILNMGRILKIGRPNIDGFEFIDLSNKSSSELILTLSHPNGWMRDHAQRLLIHQRNNGEHFLPADIDKLKSLCLTKRDSNYASLHAFWTLEGLDELDEVFLQSVIENGNVRVASHAIYLAGILFAQSKDVQWIAVLSKAVSKENKKLDPYLIFTTARMLDTTSLQQWSYFEPLIEQYAFRPNIAELAISGMAGKEKIFRSILSDKEEVFHIWIEQLDQVMTNIEEVKPNRDLSEPVVYQDERTQAMFDYWTYCATCHGKDGEGKDLLAPPLNGSEYISGPAEQLILITLHGLKGPIQVAGKEYNLNAVMPGIAVNSELSDQTIAGILNFIRNGFATAPQDCTAEKISLLREETPEAGMWDATTLAQKMAELVSEVQ